MRKQLFRSRRINRCSCMKLCRLVFALKCCKPRNSCKQISRRSPWFRAVKQGRAAILPSFPLRQSVKKFEECSVSTVQDPGVSRRSGTKSKIQRSLSVTICPNKKKKKKSREAPNGFSAVVHHLKLVVFGSSTVRPSGCGGARLPNRD